MLKIYLDLSVQKFGQAILEFSQHDLSSWENTQAGQNWENHIH